MGVLSDNENALINQWYQLDENPFEPVYVLRPVDSATKEVWSATEKQLQNILRRASDRCLEVKTISESEHKEFHISGELSVLLYMLLNVNSGMFSDDSGNSPGIEKQ